MCRLCMMLIFGALRCGMLGLTGLRELRGGSNLLLMGFPPCTLSRQSKLLIIYSFWLSMRIGLIYCYQICWQLFMSRISQQGAGKPARPKIFGQWPKNPMRFIPSHSKQVYRADKKQSIRAEQALHKSLMILVNITNFLEEKKKNSKIYEELKQESNQYKKILEELSTERGRAFNGEEYELNLKNYYEHIRKSRRFYRESEAFMLANLENYDARVTSVKLTRTYDQATKQLNQKITDLKAKRWRLQQSLVRFEQDMEQSEILNSQYNFDNCLQTMQRQMTQQKMQQIHYLMLYELQDSSRQNTQFYQSLENDQESYSVYQAIHDSMKLMINQKQEMRNDRKQLEKKFSALTIDNASTIIPASHQSLPILLRNQQVYDANVQLLARYNAETNLADYASRRKDYAKELEKYKYRLRSWRNEQQICTYLFARHETLSKYIKRQSLGDNHTNAKAEREDIKQAYYDCLNCQVPEQFTSIRKYRVDLIKDLGSALQQSGIIMPQRKQFLLASQSLVRNREQTKFHKYLNFFIQLQKIPNKEKASYLLAHHDKMRALNYELGQYNGSTEAVNNYKNDFDYCLAIAQHQQNSQDLAYIDKVEKYRKNKWISLPIGLDSLAFYYTNDVFIKNDAERYIRQDFDKIMTAVSEDVETKIRTKGVQDEQKLTNDKQYPHELLAKMVPQQRRAFFFNYYRKISEYGQFCKRSLFDDYWKTAQKFIFSPYVNLMKGQGIEQKKIVVSKKHFFTLRILAYLVNEPNKIKLSSYTELIMYYIDQIEKYCMFKWDQAELFLEIIKQRVFMKFLQGKLDNREDLMIEAKVMQKINQACILLYETKDHIALSNTDELQTHFAHSIRIHRSWEQISFQINPHDKLELQQKCRKFITGVKKSPITLGTKASLDQIEAIVNVRNKVEKIKIINKIAPGMAFLCAVYTRCHNLLFIYDNLSSTYTPSDLVLVTDNNKKSLYLNELQDYSRRQLSKLKPLLIKIMGIYKGKQIDKSQIKMPKSQQQIENVLNEIIVKLQGLAI